MAELTHLSNRPMTEVEALRQEVAAIVPAGNIVGLVMSGLVRLRSRNVPAEQVKSDITALLRGIEVLPRHLFNNALYSTFVLGPGAVLAAYQKLLALTGKDLDSAFPDGLWQFYLEFAMREDSARHANETTGFQKALVDYALNLSEADQLAAWVSAVSQLCFQYDHLLDSEWREQTYLNLLEQAAVEAGLGADIRFQRLHRAWAIQRPYRRGRDAGPDETYIKYRRRRFVNFLQPRLEALPRAQREWVEAVCAERAGRELTAYQRQMTLLASLIPESYRESRRPLALWQTNVGLIVRDRYYLLPICQTDPMGYPLLFETPGAPATVSSLHPGQKGELYDAAGHLLEVDRTGQVVEAETKRCRGYLRPAQFQAIRRQTAAIFRQSPVGMVEHRPYLDEQLILIKRGDQEKARKALKSAEARSALEAFHYAPVIINWDEQAVAKPLAYIRRARRGIGDHPLTLLRTSNSMVFDQSHIFFDGVWGIAFSEILTGEAISWAAYFSRIAPPEPAHTPPYTFQLIHEPALHKFTQTSPLEVSAESALINTKALYNVLRLLPKRHSNLKLTVNDLLILYRCEFGHEYRPSARLKNTLIELQAQPESEAQKAGRLIEEVLESLQSGNPSLMIPMNAIAARPCERLYPTTFRNPFTDLWPSYQKVADALKRYLVSQTQAHWMFFNEERRSLLVQLDYFGQLLRAYKKVAMAGGSPSTATMKLLAHVPHALIKLLHEIPQQIDVLNEIIKGEEVFSNVGRVAREASLSRFISAKDDNENKALVWGVMTDDSEVLHVSLRDFRPYIAALHQLGRIDLAEMIVTDYLEAFTVGFNQFVATLLDILNAKATHAAGKETV